MISNFNSSDMDKLDIKLRACEKTLSLARSSTSRISDKGNRKVEDIEDDTSDNATSSSSTLRTRIEIEVAIKIIKE
uniref:Uncharacterized protein n=1 Tax=Cannabis sativa TaxID=3483 RepID=A0A803PUQ2_CANSA